MSLAGLVLAGGSGTRFGGVDKALLELCGQPLIAHLLSRLRPQVADIAISANGDPARFHDDHLPVLADGALAGRGPLAGVAAGLAWAAAAGAEALLTVPVDTPFIPRDLAARLSPAPSVAVWRERQHHLVTLWPVTALPVLQTYLAAPGDHRVRDALALIQARPVRFTTPTDPFLNINTPADLEAAAHRLATDR